MEKKKKKNKAGIGLLVSLLLAALVFVLLIILSNELTKKEDKISVVIAIHDIPANTLINENAAGQYFTTKMVAKDLAHSGIFHSIKEIFLDQEIYVTETLREYELVSKDAILQGSPLVGVIEDPVAMGIKVDNFQNAAGGTLRRGDLVDLCTTDSLGNEKSLRVYVLQAFDQSGKQILNNDSVSVAVAFNLLIERKQYMSVAEIVSTRKHFDLIKVKNVY